MKKVGIAFFVTLVISSNLSATGPVTPAGFKAQQQSKVTFKENKGQVSDQNYKPRPDVLYSGTDGNMAYHLKDNGISYQLNRIDSWKEEDSKFSLPGKEKRQIPNQTTVYRLDINWLNVNRNAVIEKGKAIGGYDNYYLEVCPNGVTNVKTFEGVTYKNIYSGIDLHYYSNEGHLKYDYIVKPNADYKQIQLQIEGADKITINQKGELVMATPLGEIIEQAPVVMQEGKLLYSKWVLSDKIITFSIDKLDNTKSFVIDPITCVRQWGTYYGGLGDDYSYGCAADTAGNVYLTGVASSNTGTVIATNGSHQFSYAGSSSDAFLAKFTGAGVRLWATYYGGTGGDYGFSCAIDPTGHLVMAGITDSNSGTSIATLGSHQPSYSGGFFDIFLVKFDNAGTRVWGTYYGGTNIENYPCCVADAKGNVYLSGLTGTTTGTVIATPLSHQPSFGGGPADAFLAKFNTNGKRIWSTYYGGNAEEDGYACALDTTGNIYLCGFTETATGTAIATAASHQPTYAGGQDGFLVKFDSLGVRQWGTYYGGSLMDVAQYCSTDRTGNIFITGLTKSTTGTVIATATSYQPLYGGGISDSYIVKFDPSGNRIWGTYYGGSNEDLGWSCATDSSGNIYLSGTTQSSNGTSIATGGSHQTVKAFNPDAFLAKLNSNGVREWGTYYGGPGTEYGYSCATDLFGNVFLSGQTDSNGGIDIASSGSHQPFYGGGVWDCFLTKFNQCVQPPSPTNTTSGVNLAFCTAKATTLTATGTGVLNWYTSSVGGIAIATGTSYITPSLSVTTSYYVENVNCSPSFSRTVITVTVYPNPVVSIFPANPTICFGNSVTLIALGASTYTWNTGANTYSISASPSVATSYTVIGTSAQGCTGPNNTGTISVTVNPNPTVNVTSTSSVICSGTSVTLTATGASEYLWDTNDTTASIIVTPTANITYTVVGSNSLNCSNTQTVNVIVNPSPNLTINSSSISLCFGDSETLTVNGALTYTWNNSSNNSSITVSPTISTTYNVSGTDGNGCVGSVSKVVVVNPLPIINIITADTLLCLNYTTTLTANGGLSYTWNNGANGSNIAVSPTVTTSYSVTGTDANGCTNTAVFTQSVDACVGIKENSKDNSRISIYPNPNNGEFTISIGKIPENTFVEIYNGLGQMIKRKQLIEIKTKFNLCELANGIYLVLVRDNSNYTFKAKVVKE